MIGDCELCAPDEIVAQDECAIARAHRFWIVRAERPLPRNAARITGQDDRPGRVLRKLFSRFVLPRNLYNRLT
jgi:hypothetical protein